MMARYTLLVSPGEAKVDNGSCNQGRDAETRTLVASTTEPCLAAAVPSP